MSRFPSSMPFDIVSNILSHLNQADCIQCMRVCHDWHTQIPLYTTDLWKVIAITPRSWKRTNECLMRCLGPHVQEVVIQNVGIFAVLNSLKDAGCVIHTLVIEGQVVPFRHLFEGIPKLLASITQFRDTLKELCIQEQESYILIPQQLLDHFANLTHLTLLFRPVLFKELAKPHEHDVAVENGFHNRLVYLHLDSSLNFDDRIIPALRYCPNLRILVLSARNIDNAVRAPTSIDNMFRLCTHLSHLLWNKLRYHILSHDCLLNEWRASAENISRTENVGAMRELVYHGDNLGSILPAITRSQNDLERLELNFRVIQVGFDGDELSRINLSRLKKLSLCGFQMAAETWVLLLAGCENLEYLTLEILKDDLDMDTLCSVICRLKHVRYLKLNRPNAYHDDMWNNSELLSRTPLEYLELKGVSLTTEALLNLCSVPSLKTLSLSIFSQISYVSTLGLHAFAGSLINSQSCLETLKLSYFDDLDNYVLERLAEIETLSLLRVVGSSKITDAGVKSFVKNRNKHAARKRMEVQQCLLVLRWGIWTEEDVC